MKSNNIRNLTLYGGLVWLVLIISSLSTVAAHPPTSITLEYDIDGQELSVSISHTVMDETTHFIKSVTVEKNGVELFKKEYFLS